MQQISLAAVAGLKEQSSTRLVKEYSTCHLNTTTRYFFVVVVVFTFLVLK